MTPIIIAFANLIFRIKKSDCFGSEIEISSPKDGPPKGLQ
jgi:galactitol-specific phosphotransferase system IIC component